MTQWTLKSILPWIYSVDLVMKEAWDEYGTGVKGILGVILTSLNFHDVFHLELFLAWTSNKNMLNVGK